MVFALILLGIGVLLYRGDLSAPDRQSPDTGNVPQAAPADQAEAPTAGPPSSRPAGPAPAPPRDRSYLGRVAFGVALMSLGVLGFLDAVVPGFDPSVRHYMALLVAVVGLGLVVGAWFGRAGGLVALGIVLVPVVLVALMSDTVKFDFSTSGDGYHRPAGVDEIPDAYRLGIGSLVVDLREADFRGRVVEVEAEVGIGELTVYLPQDVATDVSGRVGMGSIRTWDHLGATSRQGIGLVSDYASEGADGMIILDASVGLGEIEVRTLPRTTRPSTEPVDVEDGQ